MEFDEVIKKVETIKNLNVDLMFQLQDGNKTIYKLEVWDFGILNLAKILWKIINNWIKLRRK